MGVESREFTEYAEVRVTAYLYSELIIEHYEREVVYFVERA